MPCLTMCHVYRALYVTFTYVDRRVIVLTAETKNETKCYLQVFFFIVVLL